MSEFTFYDKTGGSQVKGKKNDVSNEKKLEQKKKMEE